MVRTSVLCLAVFAFPAAAGENAPAPQDKSGGEALEFQKKLAERVSYGVKIQTTLDKVLADLLGANGIPVTVNEEAFAEAGVDKPGDILSNTTIDPFEMPKVSRTVLKRLLGKIPSTSQNGVAIFVLRRNALEITTREAYKQEFFPESDGTLGPLPPLAYASFEEEPLADALKELAHSAEVNVLIDGRVAAEAKTKVSGEFVGAPVDTAIGLLADSAGLMSVRVDNVYYVTSRENGGRLRKEQEEHRKERQEQGFPTGRVVASSAP